MYLLWAALLVLANILAWTSNLFVLPGNWVVVGLTALFAVLFPAGEGEGIRWLTVGLIVGLAALGELIEFLAGAAGAAKEGGSRRSNVLAILGAVVGSVFGATLTLPIPLVGPVIGALGGGALGAFLGAYIGETWVGRSHVESYSVGRGALVGRLLGTAGKMACGAVMVVIVAVDAFV